MAHHPNEYDINIGSRIVFCDDCKVFHRYTLWQSIGGKFFSTDDSGDVEAEYDNQEQIGKDDTNDYLEEIVLTGEDPLHELMTLPTTWTKRWTVEFHKSLLGPVALYARQEHGKRINIGLAPAAVIQFFDLGHQGEHRWVVQSFSFDQLLNMPLDELNIVRRTYTRGHLWLTADVKCTIPTDIMRAMRRGVAKKMLAAKGGEE